jgi:ribosomal protein L15
MSQDHDEVIYVLTNEAMPGYVKIGKTHNLEQRVHRLSATAVPFPFTIFYACTVKDAHFTEHQLHDAFDDNRMNPKREFFKIAPERVVAALKLVEIENRTPKKEIVLDKEDQHPLNEARKRRSRFNFNMVKIPIGAELTFSRDKNVKAKVVNPTAVESIEMDGKRTNLSSSAQKILGYQYPVAGTDYWMYKGETLDERRRRFEEDEKADS